jgi:thiol-disulfide isomerase/thioredoxin
MSALFMPLVISAQNSAKVVKLPSLKNLIEGSQDSIRVINFWATWCAPCVKELPVFETLNQNKTDKVTVTLVSMDLELDPNPEKVHRFVARKNLTSSILILDERDPNAWIDKIDSKWSGALPATLVVNSKNGKRRFIEGEMTAAALAKLIADVQ